MERNTKIHNDNGHNNNNNSGELFRKDSKCKPVEATTAKKLLGKAAWWHI